MTQSLHVSGDRLLQGKSRSLLNETLETCIKLHHPPLDIFFSRDNILLPARRIGQCWEATRAPQPVTKA